MGPDPSRTVTAYEAVSLKANIDLQVNEKKSHTSEQNSTDASADYDTFAAHK